MGVLQLFAMCLNAGPVECPVYVKQNHYYDVEVIAPMCVTMDKDELPVSLSTKYVRNDGQMITIKVEAIPTWKCQKV